MTHKMFWGLGALIVFVIAAGGFMYWQWSTVQQMKKQTALFEEMIQKNEKPVAVNEPPPAAPGKKWVPHGDHFHEVPIDAPDVWQGGPHEPIVQTYDGPLTYHEELLKTDSVQALRLQAEQRGHWMSKWIPPFPVDDQEASELASVVYTIIYNRHASLDESPEQDILVERAMSLMQEYGTRYPVESDDVKVRARNYDLTKLVWAILPNRLFDDNEISRFPSKFTIIRRTQ